MGTKQSERGVLKMRKYKIGDKVFGFKELGRKYHGKIGTLVDAYITINSNYNVWRNPAYVVLYPDGERRTWQWIRHVFVNGGN